LTVLIVRIRWTPIFGAKRRQILRRRATRRSKLALGVLMLAPALPVSTIADVAPRPMPPLTVARPYRPAEAIAAFMREHDFAKPYNIGAILEAANRAAIPPSMIVCIEYFESSGGKYFDTETNNPLGWKNGTAAFPSVPAAIHHVSEQLGSGRWYAGKSIEEKLHMYNPRPVYAEKVLGCMNDFPE
jgi:hypothetical protein